MRLLASPYLLPVILTLMAGCQDDGGPAAPVAQQVPQDPPAALITGTHVEQAAIGLAHLRLAPGPDGWSAELLPMRFGSVAGDAYLIDVTNFFRKSPCGDCAEVTAVGIESNGQLNVEITAHHPFRAPAADGSPRADLHIFDLMGMVVSNASAGEAQAFAPDNVAVRTSGTVLNADGFSALFDESLENYIQTPAVDAHPYKVFNVDGGPGNYDESFPNGFADLSAPTGRNVFPMGGTAAVTYSLNVPADKEVLWGYALIASYGQSARRRGAALGERQNPKYFLPEFNTKAPWRVTAQFLNNDLTAGTTSSTAQLQVAVRDWQQEAETASNWDFDTTPLGQVRDDSKITGVHVAIPDVMGPAPLTQTPDQGTGNGVFQDMSFTFLIPNAQGAAEGTYGGLVTVTDSLTGTTIGLDRDLVPLSLGGFTTYQYFEVEVMPNPNLAPVLNCPLMVSPNPPIVNVPAQFSAAAATDPDGPGPITYQWDFDYQNNGTDFSPPDGTTSTPNTTSTFNDQLLHTVGIRAVDSLGAASAPCTVTFAPVAGLACAEQPQFAVQNQTDIVENYLRHYYDGGIGGYPAQGWNDSIAVSPVSSDVYILATSRLNGQTYGGFYVQRSSDGGCTWGPPVLVANRNDPPPPPPHPATNFDQWSTLPYTATLGVTADGHPVVAFMEGICWTRFVYGTNSGANSTSWALPQTVFIENWGSYYEWFHHVLPDPNDPARISIVWRGAKQSGETFPGGSLSGCIRMATTTDAGPSATWMTRVLVDGVTGGGLDKRNVFASLGSPLTGDQKDVFAVWNSDANSNLFLVKYEFSTDMASPVVQVESAGGIHRDPNLVVDGANNPIVLYDTAGTGRDVVARKGVDGFPPTFPNPPVTVNSAFLAGDQISHRATVDRATNRLFVLVQDEGTGFSQLKLVTLNSAMAVTDTIDANTNDPSGTAYYHRHPHIDWRAPHLFLLWQDSQYTFSSPTTESQWRDALRILSR